MTHLPSFAPGATMRARYLVPLVAALLLQVSSLAAQRPVEHRLAITVDDLPAVAVRDSAEVATLTRAMLDAFEAHAVTATGFVNAGKVDDGPQRQARIAVLRAWLTAGHELGNHGAFHLSANDAPLDLFLHDVVLGDSLPRALSAEAGRPYRFHRLPFLHSGTSDTARATVDSALASLGLRAAPVSVDARDSEFNAAWVAARAAGDSATLARLPDAFLDFVDATLVHHDGLAARLGRKRMTHVLLLHATPFTAHVLDALLTRLHARPTVFVPLHEAVADPVYAAPDRYRGRVGLAWLQRLAIHRQGVRIDDTPEPPAWVRAAGTD
jgi:peptidoglycan/xylan/chitin deacetylase (PgdA/CDA1 family)